MRAEQWSPPNFVFFFFFSLYDCQPNEPSWFKSAQLLAVCDSIGKLTDTERETGQVQPKLKRKGDAVPSLFSGSTNASQTHPQGQGKARGTPQVPYLCSHPLLYKA